MNVLGFDTSTAATSACVLRDDGAGVRARCSRPPQPPGPRRGSCCRRSPTVLGEAGFALRRASTRSRSGVGPGTFTGLRIGVATARALALVDGRRAAPGLVAGRARPRASTREPALPLIDARRGEVFAALYEAGELRFGPLAAPPEAVAERVREAGVDPLAAGDGSVRFRGVLEAAGIRVAPEGSRAHVVRGLHICRLAATAPPTPPEAVVPDYVRCPDAKPAKVTDLDIRRLTYADLPQVIAIERRAFPTPWSLAMFVLELSKPSGICLAATRDGRLVGYLVCSRYDTVWHLMNVAVDERLVRQGIATALIERLFELGRRARRAVHARGADVQRRRRSALREVRLPLGGPPARLLPRQPRGRPDHVAHEPGRRGQPGQRVILGIETSCDDTCAAVVAADGRDPLERDRLAGPAARALRRRGARDRVAPPPGAARRGDRGRARARRRRARTTSRPWRSRARPA